jgi:hypothetical protein
MAVQQVCASVITEKEFDELLNRAKNKSEKKVVSLVLK